MKVANICTEVVRILVKQGTWTAAGTKFTMDARWATSAGREEHSQLCLHKSLSRFASSTQC